MKFHKLIWIPILFLAPLAHNALAYDCSGLQEWKRQAYYLPDSEVTYKETAYVNSEASKRDVPDKGDPWSPLGACDDPGGGGGGGGGDVDPQPISIYGAWHCGDDYCTWGSVPDMGVFDVQNEWLVNRGDGQPSVNLVILSFVHPLRLLHGTNDEQTLNGLPRGMTQDVVDYFKDSGVRVMLSIGGITYTDAWNEALAENGGEGARLLGEAAAAVAGSLEVGIEIDYEENRNPNLDGLQDFIDAYRSVHAYDASGANHAARLTIDLAAGDRWLIALTERATRDWLNPANPVLDYANAMVTPRPDSADNMMSHWQEHIDGKPQYDPPIPPLAPAKLTGSLWLTGRKPLPECVDFGKSLQHPSATGDFVQLITPNGAGSSNGMLGYMFWAAGCQGTRSLCTTPADDNSCEGGMGAAAAHYNIPIPMPGLRQE
jgi:hypothetical protein